VTASRREAGRRVLVRSRSDTFDGDTFEGVSVEPQAPGPVGPDEVLVAIRAAGVGWVDLMMLRGRYQHLPALPYTPGLEGAGEVVEVGARVRDVRVGDRVVVDGLLVGPRSFGAYQDQGTFASYVCIPEATVSPIPGDLSFDEAATLYAAFETAYHAVVVRGGVQAGETVLVLGASGATGLAAVQVAKALGAVVIAAGRSAAKLDVVRAVGADHVVTLVFDEVGEVLPYRDEIKQWTDGRGVDVVIDGVGGGVGAESLRALRFGGRLVIVGWASTPDLGRSGGAGGQRHDGRLATNLVLMKGLDVLGAPVAISTLRDPSIRPARVERIRAWVEAGAFRPHVSHVFALDKVSEALAARWRGEVVGGCVLRP
jgi:NADPH2:quinone reductase